MAAYAAYAAFAVLLAVIAWLVRPMIAMLHANWGDIYGAHSHGYLVLALAVYFAARAWRAPPPAATGRPVWAALPALLLLLALAGLSEAMFIGPSRTALLPPLLLAAIALCLGAEALRRLAWPVLFLYFALPVWVALNEPLRRLTTTVSQSLVRLTGIPMYVEGNLVHLSAGTFEIAAGCSGLNFLVAALTLAAVQCTLYLRTWAARVRLLVVAALAALAANWLRVASLVVIGHVTDMQHYLIRVNHLWYGWGLFLAIMVPVYLYGVRLERREEDAPEAPRRSPAGVAMPWLWRAAAIGLWVLCGGLLLGVSAVLVAGRGGDVASAAPAATQLRGQALPGEFPSGWAPRFAGARESRSRLEPGGAVVVPVETYTAHFSEQTRTARISQYGNTAAGRHWQVLASRLVDDAGSPDGRPWLEQRGVDNGVEALLWQRYEAAGEPAWSKPTLRAREVQGMLAGRRDATVLALRAACVPDCGSARSSIIAALAVE